MKKKRRKKTPRQKLISRLDEIFSLVVRKRGLCERCDKTINLQCSHVFPRDNFSVRWDLLNAFCLCAGCHAYWWHQEPILAAEFTKAKLGALNYNALLNRARAIKKWTEPEMQELLIELQKEYERMPHDSD